MPPLCFCHCCLDDTPEVATRSKVRLARPVVAGAQLTSALMKCQDSGIAPHSVSSEV